MQDKHPFTQKTIRAISGRNDIKFSFDFNGDPSLDPQATGRMVLSIWNSRVEESLSEFEELRIFVMVRDMNALEFTLFEIEAPRYIVDDYQWTVNKNGNFCGFEKATGRQCFTWQKGGTQFTVHHLIPPSSYKFRITQRPVTLEEHQVIHLSRFQDSWVQKVSS